MKKIFLVPMEINGELSARDCENLRVIEAESLEDAIRIYNEKKKNEDKQKDMLKGYYHQSTESLPIRQYSPKSSSIPVEWKDVDYEGD